ncbi:allantoicase [Kockovaella imperatae]|uniref:Allantoicase n=1 Tax=Kockovaella imperatae TaxID=4999 RepID=A0A1Y1UQI2_9TREE|nr:allantoicase [Kockovaella imperatae]ORX40249.1 allantoicase [Kockovaella imperatae]
MAERIPTEDFDRELLPFLTEVSSAALGAKVLSCSDDFFASKDNLIKRIPSASLKGQFGPNGALYDGWESRRHNPTFDWVIILLAPKLSHLTYFDIDTSHFSGNEAPASQVFALSLSEPTSHLSPNDERWQEVLPLVELGPNQRHIFRASHIGTRGVWSAVMVRMIPDGGMARFRAYGDPVAPEPYESLPPSSTEPINLLSPLTSARIIACSDANFSPPGNLLLPGRGFDMSDGWETRRSQVGRGKYAPGGVLAGQERREWVVIKMSCPGVLRWVEVDTAFHPGNYPVACKVEANLSDSDDPNESSWTTIVAQKPLGPHRQHWFDIERGVESTVFSHIRLTTFPDGGLKRLRVYGHPFAPGQTIAPTALTIPALPLTPEAFAPYGQVIQGFSLPTSAPKGSHVTIANQGTAFKVHRMLKVEHNYPEEKQADIKDGLIHPLKMLERHKYTTQAFIPMGKGTLGEPALAPGGAYLVVVARNGKDDKPDLSTLRAFMATSAQGVSYDVGTWHHYCYTLDGPLDYALIEAQIGDGSVDDCEVIVPPQPFCHIRISPFTATTEATQEPLMPPINKEHDLSDHGFMHPEVITASGFAPYGQVIRKYPNERTRPKDLDFQPAPHGLTQKYARLADISHSYPVEAAAQTAVSVFRATPKEGLKRGLPFPIKILERHPCTSQAFIPMGKGEWRGKGEDALPPGGEMLVIVALNGKDDRPDPKTVKAFRVPSSIGISYHQGIWHHPVLVVDQTMDLACVETQISTGIPEPDPRDCEVLQVDEPWGIIAVPS